MKQTDPQLTDTIIKQVANYFSVDPEDMIKQYNRPSAQMGYIRHIAFYILNYYYSNARIKEIFDCNHATVSYGVQKIIDFICIKDEGTIRALQELLPDVPRPYHVFRRKKKKR